MNQVVTKGIVLSRTNYGEADRIITVITPDQGKVRLMVKGARKVKSKLAGGIELFVTAQISYIPGRKDIGTLTSSRLETHYGNIVKDIDRTMFGYEILKMINRITEDNSGPEYYDLLLNTEKGLNDSKVNLDIIRLWLYSQILRMAGHSPNLKTDTKNKKLTQEQAYSFSFDDMAFALSEQGSYRSSHIKLLRLGIGLDSPEPLVNVKDINTVLPECVILAKTMLQQFVKI